MDTKKFEAVVQLQHTRCLNVLVDRKKRYARGEDRLEQFKVAAQLSRTTPIKALGGMMSKHTTTLYDLIEHGGPARLWDEVLTDNMNYLHLLNALLVERRGG